MGKLGEFRTERGAITKEHDERKVSIHANYMRDLQELEEATARRRRALARRQRAFFNKALEKVKEEEIETPSENG